MLMMCCGASGQVVDKYGIPWQSVNVQVADGTLESLVGVFVGIFAIGIEAAVSQGEQTSDLVGWTPFISAGYDYHFTDTRWNIGTELGYWHIGLRHNNSGVTDHFHFATLAETFKFFYKPAGSCKLYGGINLGAGAFLGGDSLPQVIPAFQVNPIGMRWGCERIAFQAELGVGYKGILQLGATVAL